MDKQIAGLIKQNLAIYNSLQAKNIEVLGELVVPDSELGLEEQKEILLKENARLKELVKASKPPEVPKAPKVQAQVQESKPKPKQTDSDDEENFEPPAPKYSTIANMEDLKRAFFSGEYAQFEELVKSTPYKFYTGVYKYSSDKDGAPDYSARNLVKGFVRSFDDYRKYFMICFRCMQVTNEPTTYSYPSLWIVNTLDSVGSVLDDFDLVPLEAPTESFFQSMRKMDQDVPGFIGEGYVH